MKEYVSACTRLSNVSSNYTVHQCIVRYCNLELCVSIYSDNVCQCISWYYVIFTSSEINYY